MTDKRFHRITLTTALHLCFILPKKRIMACFCRQLRRYNNLALMKKEEKQWLEAISITTANFVGIKDKHQK